MQLKEYENVAIRMLVKFGHWNMHRDNECIGEVMSALMNGDATYDLSYGTQYKSYLYTCALNKIKNLNHQNKKRERFMDIPQNTKIDGHEYDILEYREIMEEIESGDLITEKQRQCILMMYRDLMTQKEIGETLGVSKQAVKQRISAGLRHLRDKFR